MTTYVIVSQRFCTRLRTTFCPIIPLLKACDVAYQNDPLPNALSEEPSFGSVVRYTYVYSEMLKREKTRANFFQIQI